MILQRFRIIGGDFEFEPGTSVPEGQHIYEPPHLPFFCCCLVMNYLLFLGTIIQFCPAGAVKQIDIETY